MFGFSKKYIIGALSFLVVSCILCGTVAAAEIPKAVEDNVIAVSAEPGWSYTAPDGVFSVEYVDTVDLPPAAMAPTYPMARSLDTGIPPISEARGYEPNITYEYRKMTSSEIYNVSPDTVLLASAASAAVTGPDLELRNLTANLREPFPYDREVTFKFELANIGTETASEVYVEFLVDRQHLYTATMEDILPGYVVTVSWPVSKLDGLREIEFRAYCDLVEVTYDNNFI